jgi:hypothetical protein
MEAYVRAGQVSTSADQAIVAGQPTWTSVVAAAAVTPEQLALMRASRAEENYLAALADAKEREPRDAQVSELRIRADELWVISGGTEARCTCL